MTTEKDEMIAQLGYLEKALDIGMEMQRMAYFPRKKTMVIDGIITLFGLLLLGISIFRFLN